MVSRCRRQARRGAEALRYGPRSLRDRRCKDVVLRTGVHWIRNVLSGTSIKRFVTATGISQSLHVPTAFTSFELHASNALRSWGG